VNGFVLHTPKYMFGVQVIDIPKNLPSDQVCAVTMYPLNELDRVGALVWAHKNPTASSSSSSETEEKKTSNEIQWRFVCLPEEHDGKQGSTGKLHLFDFDSIRGFVESEKDFTKCPLCKRGSYEKALVSQVDVSFTEDLLSQRHDLLHGNSPDYEMALFYEMQIVRQVVLNDEEKHRSAILDMVRHWNTHQVLHSLEATLQVCFEKDRVTWFKDLLLSRAELASAGALLTSLEQSCRYEAAAIVMLLITEFKPQVSKHCFEYLIGHRNEYLIDQMLDYYVKWTSKEGGATQEQLLRGDDWLNLGRFAVVRREFPSFVRAVQLKGIYRLLDKIRQDDQVQDVLLAELGLQAAAEIASPGGDDGWDDWGDEQGSPSQMNEDGWEDE
jgi:hypothetical protein